MLEVTNITIPSPVVTVDACSNVRTRISDGDDHGDDHRDEHARHLSHLRSLPEVRADRIAKIKSMIADGTFDTEERLSAAIDRMVEELRQQSA